MRLSGPKIWRSTAINASYTPSICFGNSPSHKSFAAHRQEAAGHEPGHAFFDGGEIFRLTQTAGQFIDAAGARQRQHSGEDRASLKLVRRWESTRQ